MHGFRHVWLVLVVAAVAAVAALAHGPSSTAATTSAKATTITFWHGYSPAEVEALEKVVIPRFEKQHPNIDVQPVAIPYDQFHQKLITGAAGGELPDVFRSDIIWVPELAELGLLVRLDKAMKDFKTWADLMFPGPLATNKWKGGYYGLPLDTNTRVLMYNQAALRKAGFRKPPRTFQDLQRMAPALKRKGVQVFADGGTSGWSVLPWIWSGGGSLTNPTLTRASGYLNSAKSVAAVDMLVQSHKRGHARFVNVDGGMQTSDGLPKGKYATILDGPWMFPIFQGQYPSFKLRTSKVPAGAGGSVSVVGGEDIVVTTASKNKAASYAFVRFMVSKYAQLEMAKVGQMTIRKDLKEQMVKIRPYYGIFLEQLKTARPRTPHPQWPKIDQTLESHVARAVKGELTTKQALDRAAKEIDKLLKRR